MDDRRNKLINVKNIYFINMGLWDRRKYAARDSDSMVDVVIPVGGWSDGMQIPTYPPEEPKPLIHSEGFIQFKRLQIPAGFVYHKISIPASGNIYYDGIKHETVKLDDGMSFKTKDDPLYIDPDFGPFTNYSVEEGGVNYNLCPSILMCFQTQKYVNWPTSGNGYGYSYIINIYLKIDLRDIAVDFDKNIFGATSNGTGNWYGEYNKYKIYFSKKYPEKEEIELNYGAANNTNDYWTIEGGEHGKYWKENLDKLEQWVLDFVRSDVGHTSFNNTSLEDIINKSWVEFKGASIEKWNMYKSNGKVTSNLASEQHFLYARTTNNVQGFFNYLESDNTTFSNFHKNTSWSYYLVGVCNAFDIGDNVDKYAGTNMYEEYEDIWTYSNMYDISSSYNGCDGKLIDYIAFTILNYKKTFLNENNYQNDYQIRQISDNTMYDISNEDNKLQKLKECSNPENDILWGKGADILSSSDLYVRPNKFKKNEIILKIKKN